MTTSGSGELIVILKACCAVSPAGSWTWAVKVLVSTLVGVPVISVDSTPKNLAIFSPAGRWPATTRHWSGPVEVPEPPLAEMDRSRKVLTLKVPRSHTPLVQVSPTVLMVSGVWANTGRTNPSMTPTTTRSALAATMVARPFFMGGTPSRSACRNGRMPAWAGQRLTSRQVTHAYENADPHEANEPLQKYV